MLAELVVGSTRFFLMRANSWLSLVTICVLTRRWNRLKMTLPSTGPTSQPRVALLNVMSPSVTKGSSGTLLTSQSADPVLSIMAAPDPLVSPSVTDDSCWIRRRVLRSLKKVFQSSATASGCAAV